MCTTCGCGMPDHDHRHDHGHHHHHHDDELTVRLEADIMAVNNAHADANERYLAERHITAYNLVSSPGSGKTALLEALIGRMAPVRPVCVIEGDQHTDNDARRITARGVAATQINTANGCHLDAHMVGHALERLDPPEGSVLFIENVGNLVCPAMFRLGEAARIVVISVTEGDDKPLKYPYMFAGSQICVINKIDLLPYVDSSLERIRANALSVSPGLRFFEVSATRGTGIDALADYLLHPQP